jgi:DNA invertase Pin-like site-specific DNA recombinase
VNIDGYIRVSRVNGREGDRYISPAVQREKIAAFAKVRGHTIVKWWDEQDQSGAKADRPMFQAALARVESGETQGIAVAKLDRFARSVTDGGLALRRIRDAGGELVLVEEGLDTSTPIGKAMFTVMLTFAELQLDTIRENWRTAQRYAVERGVHVASRPPTGYRRSSDGRLEPDKRDAAAVAEVFQERAGGASLSQLARLLESKSVRGPYQRTRDRPYWTASAVSKLLRNPVYTGQARSGRHVKEDAHAAIVTASEWGAAQNGRPVSPARSGDGALLAGLLRCCGCRHVLKPDTMKLRDGRKERIYRCRGEHASGRCEDRSAVLGRLIEPYVEEQFLAARAAGGVLAHSEPAENEVAELSRALAEGERLLEEWVADARAQALGDLYWSGLEARQAAVDEARAALDELGGPGDTPLLPDDVELRAVWPSLSIAERRRLLTVGVDAVMLRSGKSLALDERVLILWAGQGPDDLPRRGRRAEALTPFAWPS